jgi:protein SCO1/2
MNKILFFLSFLILVSCTNESKKLHDYSVSIINSSLGPDTIIKAVPDFEFTNQLGNKVNNETFKDDIYVVDFFFTSCPGICPVMTKNMLRVYEKYNLDLKFLSHSIDQKRDDIPKLKKYAEKIGIINDEKWHFVMGTDEGIKKMAKNYMILAYEDTTVAGGFEHGGQFVLIDKQQHVRGYYDGTDEEAVDKLIDDIAILKLENK